MTRTRAQRGFTLVELMVVVAIISVMASLAVIAMRKSRTENDVDAFSNAIRTAMIQARRRAVAMGTQGAPYGYMVDIKNRSVRWCQVDPATVTGGNVTSQKTCTPAAGLEMGGLVNGGADAQVDFYAPSADVVTMAAKGVVSYTAPAHTPLPATGIPIYFGPSGVCDGTFANVLTLGGALSGFTVYVEPITTDSGAKFKQRRVVLYGVSARPRIVDTW